MAEPPAGPRVTMTYAADGLRASSQEGANTTRFVWDGQNYLLETDSSGITQAIYTNTVHQYGDLISQRRAGTSSFYLFDALGSTDRLTDAGQTITGMEKVSGTVVGFNYARLPSMAQSPWGHPAVVRVLTGWLLKVNTQRTTPFLRQGVPPAAPRDRAGTGMHPLRQICWHGSGPAGYIG